MQISLSILFILVIVCYSILILVFAIAYYFKREKNISVNSDKPVSIIVAFRNEEKNLRKLIRSLINQSFKGNYEILLVNDHSSDNYIKIISEFNDDRIKLFDLPEGIETKKNALRFAAELATTDILLFTDADCEVPYRWIELMSGSLMEKNLEMLCGPVEFINQKSFLSKLFSLEFLSLIGSGASGFFINKPFMCNAANYVIKKQSFCDANLKLNDKYSSGDDVFLLHHLKKNDSVGFIKNQDVIVKTKSPENIKQFIDQRVRWASKTTGYDDFFAILVALVNFLMAFLLMFLLGISFFYFELLYPLLIVFSVKFSLDFVFMIPIAKFHKKSNLLFYYPILSVLHPVYFLFVGFLSLFYKPMWKGRRIK